MTGWGQVPSTAPSREQVEAALRPALPTVARRYYAFYRTARNAWWKPLAAVAVGLAWLIAVTVVSFVVMAADGSLEQLTAAAQAGANPLGSLKVTPTMFLANNVGVALATVFAMLGQWALWGQRPRWLSSVAGGFRWRWFGRCLLWFLPFVVALVVIGYLTEPPSDVRWREYSALMIVGILLTTPFQAAGEEYLVRGLLQRATASWFRSDLVGWLVSTVVGGLVFVSLHAAADPWLNAFYFLFAGVLSWMVWQTGGLEASVAAHIVNNVVAEALMPFTDFSGVFDRGVGAGSPAVLVQVVVLAIPAAILVWQARRLRLVTESAPGVAQVDAALAPWRAPAVPPPPSGFGGVG